MKFNVSEPYRHKDPTLDLLKRTPLYALYRHMTWPRKMIAGYWNRAQENNRRLKFFRKFIKPGDLVFDVGANMGTLTKIFLALQAKVVAFEPQQICSDHLESIFQQERNFTLVKKALGAKEGEGLMLISNAHMLSTLSRHWTQCTKESRRFGSNEWGERQVVPITTLDNALCQFGVPTFIKIDVEGYEYEVLSGLSRPIDCLSIEFAAESFQNTFQCIDYMKQLSNGLFQFSKGESMKFDLPCWLSAEEIKHFLADLVDQEALAWGDVYIRNLGNPAEQNAAAIGSDTPER